MARTEIKRDPKGNKVTGTAPTGPGAAKSVVTVQVTYPTGVDLRDLEQLIWETATGSKKLHLTSEAQGNTTGGKGYIHSKGNPKLLLVSRVDTAKHTIEIIRQGKVSGGVHKF
ncbi:MAG: hypothetical protein QOE97_1935 [Pseudonocardiales bacterium]|jgi:hypothetical protein|nr:hypothetical protein [Pseudonocardiales bacterium]